MLTLGKRNIWEYTFRGSLTISSDIHSSLVSIGDPIRMNTEKFFFRRGVKIDALNELKYDVPFFQRCLHGPANIIVIDRSLSLTISKTFNGYREVIEPSKRKHSRCSLKA